jgi:hypothetical protein
MNATSARASKTVETTIPLGFVSRDSGISNEATIRILSEPATDHVFCKTSEFHHATIISTSDPLTEGHNGVHPLRRYRKPMNHPRLFSTLLLLSAGIMSAKNSFASTDKNGVPVTPVQAQSTNDSRTAPPPVLGSPVKVIHPTGDFNVAEAKAALEPGAGTIAGAACVVRSVHNGPLTFQRADRETVVLYPASPYIEDMLRLLHKTKAGKASIEADPTITSVRLAGHTNEKGQFQFSKLTPGSYFVVADVHTTNTGTRDVYTGTGYSNDAFGGFTTNYYQKQGYYVNYEDILYERVEVQGNDTATATLFGGTSLFGFNAMKSKCH